MSVPSRQKGAVSVVGAWAKVIAFKLGSHCTADIEDNGEFVIDSYAITIPANNVIFGNH